MNNREIALSILHIRPNAEFSIIGDDFKDLVWLDEKQTQPTKEEIEKGWLSYQETEAQAKAEAKAKKAAAEAKLAALGLTSDDLKALGL